MLSVEDGIFLFVLKFILGYTGYRWEPLDVVICAVFPNTMPKNIYRSQKVNKVLNDHCSIVLWYVFKPVFINPNKSVAPSSLYQKEHAISSTGIKVSKTKEKLIKPAF